MFSSHVWHGLILASGLSLVACAPPSDINPKDIQQASTNGSSSSSTSNPTGATSTADTTGFVNPPSGAGGAGGGAPDAGAGPSFDATAHSVFRSDNLNLGDRMFTLHQGEASNAGYVDEGVKFELLTNPTASRVVIYRCVRSGADHFLSLDSACEGQSLDGPLGYVETQPLGTATNALYRCGNAAHHMASKDQNECTNLGFNVESTLGYTL